MFRRKMKKTAARKKHLFGSTLQRGQAIGGQRPGGEKAVSTWKKSLGKKTDVSNNKLTGVCVCVWLFPQCIKWIYYLLVGGVCMSVIVCVHVCSIVCVCSLLLHAPRPSNIKWSTGISCEKSDSGLEGATTIYGYVMICIEWYRFKLTCTSPTVE